MSMAARIMHFLLFFILPPKKPHQEPPHSGAVDIYGETANFRYLARNWSHAWTHVMYPQSIAAHAITRFPIWKTGWQEDAGLVRKGCLLKG